MTRIVAGLEALKKSGPGQNRECVWWSEQMQITVATSPRIYTSGLIPDKAIVREVQIQAASNADVWAIDITVNLAIVTAINPTLAEVRAAEQVIDWRWIKTGNEWRSIGNPTNERWPCSKRLQGANLRFAVATQTTLVGGGVVRVGILYELP